MVFSATEESEHIQCTAGRVCKRQAEGQATVFQIKSYLTVTTIDSFSEETQAVQRFCERAYKFKMTFQTSL